MVGWAKSRGESFFRESGLEEKHFLAVRNHGCYLLYFFFFKLKLPIFLFPTHGAMGRERSRVVLRAFLTTVHIRLPQVQGGNECVIFFVLQSSKIRSFTDPLSVLLLVSVNYGVNSGSGFGPPVIT